MSRVAAARCVLGITIAAALLGACAGSQTPIDPPAGVQARLARPHAARPRVQAPCVYLLSETEGASDLSHMHIGAPNCYLYINDTANMSYSTIKAAKILYAGGPPNEEGAHFPEATPAPGPAVADPCPTIRACAYLTNHPPATTGCHNGFFDGSGYTIGAPGRVTCFSSLTISGDNETVCGLIEITGSQLHVNNSDIRSCRSGVTFYLSAETSDTNFSNASLTLSPPKTGKYKNLLFYRVKSQDASINFSNCSCDLAGILYFPTAQVDYASTGRSYQLLIFGQVNFSTSNLRLGNPR